MKTSLLIDRGELRTLEVDGQPPRTYWSGQPWQLGTASYWEAAAEASPTPADYRLGADLRDEFAACILGGFGMTWDVVSPFLQLVVEDMRRLASSPTERHLLEILSTPIVVRGRSLRYRFPRQRSKRLAEALAFLEVHERELNLLSDVSLRNRLATVPGIGSKTASWIVRNQRGSDRVAVVDVHLIRAGIVAGVFSSRWNVQRHYDLYEQSFLRWCEHAVLSPSKLDAVIWGALSGRGNGAAAEILGFSHRAEWRLSPVWPSEQT